MAGGEAMSALATKTATTSPVVEIDPQFAVLCLPCPRLAWSPLVRFGLRGGWEQCDGEWVDNRHIGYRGCWTKLTSMSLQKDGESFLTGRVILSSAEGYKVRKA